MMRQCLQDGGDARGDALLSQGTALQMINWSEASPCALLELPLQALRGDLPLIDPDILVDRKSTRLNSSHLVISYAVFCLKKKKKINIEHESRSNYAQCV